MTQSKVDEFEIDGIGFRLKPLPALVAESLAPSVVSVITPAVAAFFANQRDVGQLAQALGSLAGSAAQLPKFREAFASQCQVVIGETGGEKVWSELKGKVLDDTFRRKHLRYFQWLAQCISLEYGDFLAEIGQRLAAAVKASPWSSLLGSPGASGDSPPIPESKTD